MVHWGHLVILPFLWDWNAAPYHLQDNLMCGGLFVSSKWTMRFLWFCLFCDSAFPSLGVLLLRDPCPTAQLPPLGAGNKVTVSSVNSGSAPLVGRQEDQGCGLCDTSLLYLHSHSLVGEVYTQASGPVGINTGRVIHWDLHGNKLLKTGHLYYFICLFFPKLTHSNMQVFLFGQKAGAHIVPEREEIGWLSSYLEII